jgi:hypothetical protein
MLVKPSMFTALAVHACDNWDLLYGYVLLMAPCLQVNAHTC